MHPTHCVSKHLGRRLPKADQTAFASVAVTRVMPSTPRPSGSILGWMRPPHAAFILALLAPLCISAEALGASSSFGCLRPYATAPLVRAENYTRSYGAARGGEARSAWEAEVWAAEAAAIAEATHAGGGGSSHHHGTGGRSNAADYPRLSYARELGLPPPLAIIVVGGPSWAPRKVGDEHYDPDQPLPILAFSGEDPDALAGAYAHYHGHGAAERAAYAADIRRNQATHDALSPLQRADVLVKLARLISRFESRDDVYAYGNGLPVLNDDAVSDPRCTRYSMALIHRALALVAHLPGLESRAVRRGVWADLHHGLAAMGRYDDQNLIARRLFLESPAGVPPTPAPHGPHALASDREMGMRAAAAAQHYVGAGNNEELLRNLAGVVVVPATEEEARAERERKAAAAEAPPTDEEQYVKTYRDMARATSSAVITSPPVPLSYDVTSGSNGNTRMYDFPRTTRARLRHDREQLAYLASTDAPDEIRLAPEIALPAVAAYDSVIAELGGVENVSASDGGRTDGRGDSQLDGWLRDADAYMSAPVELNLTQQVALAPYFNRELARRDEPRVPGGALAWDTLRVTELSSEPRVIMVDDVFRPEALEALIRFNRGTTMWTNVKKQGYLCAYPSGGYATPLLGQVAEELPLIDPELSCAYQLVTSWAYLYDDVRTDGIGIHADIARVNINCWITPDDANLDPPGTSGGMVIVPARPPGRWHNNFAYYNSPNASDPAFWADLNAQSGGRNITVAHKQNRCVIFDSELYHWTDRVNFKRGYDKRRINLTFLYGHPGDKTCRMRGGGSPARRKALAAALEQRAARENQPAVNDGAGIGGAATNDGASGAPPREAATGAEPTVPASFASTDREL